MHIIVEGPDASGKSTLVDWLQEQTGYNVQRSEGPEKYPGEINERIQACLSIIEPTIFDRHPAISEPIYSSFREIPVIPDPGLVQEVYQSCETIIYCQGGDLDSHVINPDIDTPQHLDLVTSNIEIIRDLYDMWALRFAHKVHRIGQSYDALLPVKLPISMGLKPMYHDVMGFHEKFDLPTYNGLMTPEAQGFRTGFIKEEFNEYRNALYRAEKVSDNVALTREHLAEALDGLVDLVYIALGTAIMHGFDFPTAWDRVHAANMKKVRATSPDQSKRNSSLDVIKPDGWETPNHIDLVKYP